MYLFVPTYVPLKASYLSRTAARNKSEPTSARQEEPTTKAASAESVRGQPESTPREEEHKTRGACSAESAPQSNPSAPESECQQPPIFNFHVNKSHFTIGRSSGNTYNYGTLGL